MRRGAGKLGVQYYAPAIAAGAVRRGIIPGLAKTVNKLIGKILTKRVRKLHFTCGKLCVWIFLFSMLSFLILEA